MQSAAQLTLLVLQRHWVSRMFVRRFESHSFAPRALTATLTGTICNHTVSNSLMTKFWRYLLFGSCLIFASMHAYSWVFFSEPQPADANELSLSSRFVHTGAQEPVLRLTLKNLSTNSVSVITGSILGGKPYPSAAFVFSLRMKDGTKVKLLCTCEGPPIIGGSTAPYTVELKPGTTFQTEVPLSALSYIANRQRHLCTAETEGAQIVATLVGRPKPAAIGTAAASYWIGMVSQSTPVTCSK